MRRGIALFDLQDFLYQGTRGPETAVDTSNERQSNALRVAPHEDAGRAGETPELPGLAADLFLPMGDGYYLLCAPTLPDILDIAICIMAMLHTDGTRAYCVAHVGEVHLFTDMTGRDNATGFDLGVCQSPSEPLERDREAHLL